MVSYVAYLGKTIWPYNLAVLYPHPLTTPLWQIAGASLIILGFSLLAIRSVKRYPYIAVGWFWYFGTLVPVIGLVQVGLQAMADRYTYVPLTGLFIIITWGVPDLIARWHHKQKAVAIIAAALLFILSATTVQQMRYWDDSITLFEHTLRVTNNNHIIHNNLGLFLTEHGRRTEGVSHYYEALRIHPGYANAHSNLGIVLLSKDKLNEASTHFMEALKTNPRHTEAHNGLGIVLANQGKFAKAITHFSEALRLNPTHAEARHNLNKVLALSGKTNKNNEQIRDLNTGKQKK